MCLVFLSPVSIFSRGSSVSSSEENGLMLKNDTFDGGGDFDFDRECDLEGDRVCDMFWYVLS